MEAWRGGIKRKIYCITGPYSTTKLRKCKVHHNQSQNGAKQNILPEKQIFYFDDATRHGKFHEMSKDIQILNANHISIYKSSCRQSHRKEIRRASSESSKYTQES
ncbi:hypothetical protein GpartN1_g2845.t1 [Galdieria partita]|uniref:Uncharacterized protein n=1 Tax=Galdieria partita TaxID=83374 RepID=A0A9C7PUI7_9RHOD|nr:hypothetical protein GpartN1_g2351.t1 [Galdieria partita]GJQ11054.1 hypothetical protein GpartN1_g2845.t1 [Galdieria partita]